VTDKIIIESTPGGEMSEHHKRFIAAMKKTDKYKLIGIDWAKDSGMNRGNIIERDNNIIHVRFKTVGANS